MFPYFADSNIYFDGKALALRTRDWRRIIRQSVRLLLTAIYMCSVCLLSISAEETQDPQNSSPAFIVAGAAALPEFEGADKFRPVPLIVSRFKAFGAEVELEGLEGKVDLLPHPVWRAGPAFGVILPRNDDFVDDLVIAELPSIGAALELGAFAGFRTPFGTLKEGALSGTVTVRYDALGAHNGLTVDGELEYFFAVNRMLRIGVAANASFATSDYFDTYFSIAAEDVVSARVLPFEASGGARDVGAEVFSILSFSPRWGIFSRVAYNRLLSDAADSPIVQDIGSPNQVFAGAGLFVSF